MAWNGLLIDTSLPFKHANLQGKHALITGGASGIGEAGVRAFIAAGVFVTIADINVEGAHALESELGADKLQFIHCDVTKWQDQKTLFKAAISRAPLDIVFANAGAGNVWESLDQLDEDGEPTEPGLTTLNTTLIGYIYTTKLALHHLKQSGLGCLIFTNSFAGYTDTNKASVYCASKWGARGLMRSLRAFVPERGIRINMIAPWFIDTNFVDKKAWDKFREGGVQFAEPEDVGKAVMRFVCDDSLNGRCFAIVPRNVVASGYMDISDRDQWDLENFVEDNGMRNGRLKQ